MSFKNFDDLKSEVNDIFFETGTFEGYCSRKACEMGFKRVITIEYNSELFMKAKKLSEGYEQIEFHHGDSSVLMPDILNKILKEKITFFLDAHPPGYCDESWPIFNELENIKNFSKQNDHTIMIDDLRLFTEKQRERMLEKIFEINKNYKIKYFDGGERNDIMCCYV